MNGLIPDELIDKIFDCTDQLNIQDPKEKEFFSDALNKMLGCA